LDSDWPGGLAVQGRLVDVGAVVNDPVSVELEQLGELDLGVDETLEKIVANGGEVVNKPYPERELR
jgi:hypothetical protein